MTMTQAEVQWSTVEQEVAKGALKKAYDREVKVLIEHVRENAVNIEKIEDIWQLHDFLSARRHDIDGKYDEREAFLMFTLSNLIKSGLLERADLEGLTADKRAKINLLTRM